MKDFKICHLPLEDISLFDSYILTIYFNIILSVFRKNVKHVQNNNTILVTRYSRQSCIEYVLHINLIFSASAGTNRGKLLSSSFYTCIVIRQQSTQYIIEPMKKLYFRYKNPLGQKCSRIQTFLGFGRVIIQHYIIAPWGMEKRTVIKHVTISAKKCMKIHSKWDRDISIQVECCLQMTYEKHFRTFILKR